MTAIPFVLVTGFLGSGKTTLLKRILARYAGETKIAVVQNEFAPSGVDGEDLRRTGLPFEILEINRGSVFCVCLLSDFVKSLASMIDTVRPGAVVLEATGLADPIAVAQLLQAPELRERVFLRHVYCVADVSTFPTMERAVTRVAHQVRIADTVILNKTDIAGADIALCERRVAQLNPFAIVEHCEQCDLGLEGLFSAPSGAPVALLRAQENAAFESCGRPPVGSAAARSTRRFSRAALERFLEAHKDCYRLKGFVNLAEGGAVAVQACFGKATILQIDNYAGPSELVAMGPEIDAEVFGKAFENNAQH